MASNHRLNRFGNDSMPSRCAERLGHTCCMIAPGQKAIVRVAQQGAQDYNPEVESSSLSSDILISLDDRPQ